MQIIIVQTYVWYHIVKEHLGHFNYTTDLYKKENIYSQ